MNYFSKEFPGLAPIFDATDEADKMIETGKKDAGSNDTLHQFTEFMFEGIPVRETVINGVVWWVAKDACDALGIKNPGDAVSDFPANEKGVVLSDTLGGPQKMLCVNEPGLYRLVFRARKPKAEAFKTWVFEKVLPQIRRTGSCGGAGKAAEAFLIIRYLEEENKSLRREVRRYETRSFLTAGDKIDILSLHVQEYPVSAIQKRTKKGRKRIKDFLNRFFSLSEKEWDAELKSWYKAVEGKGGTA
jgi:prophage antirepressor-like protein